jgi:alpha-galactosidase
VAVLVLGGFVTTGCGGKESSAPGPPPAPTPSPSVHPGKTKIGEIRVESVTQGWGTPQLDRSVMGLPLTIGGVSYGSGIGTHASSKIEVSFPPKFKTLSGACGVDGFVRNNGSIVCKVTDGDKVLFTSQLLKGGMKAAPFSIPVGGLSSLTLVVEDGGDNISSDHADWVDLTLK